MPNQLNSHYHPIYDPYFYAGVNNLSPIEMHIVKYVTRHKKKGGARDLKAALPAILRDIYVEYGIEELRSTVDGMKEMTLDVLSQCEQINRVMLDNGVQ